MSIAVSQPVRAPAEPFGQTGVRQYFQSFAALTCAYVLGDPLDEATTLGPMAAARLAIITP